MKVPWLSQKHWIVSLPNNKLKYDNLLRFKKIVEAFSL